MSEIKISSATGEIEINGTESFIASHFGQFEALLSESFGLGKKRVAQQDAADKGPRLAGVKPAPTDAPGVADAATASDAAAAGPGTGSSPQAPRTARPPVRKYFNTLGKYIRSEDTSVHKSSHGEVPRQIPEELSVASLKKKFGLSEKKIEEVIKDAERQGRVKKDPDGSYVWV